MLNNLKIKHYLLILFIFSIVLYMISYVDLVEEEVHSKFPRFLKNNNSLNVPETHFFRDEIVVAQEYQVMLNPKDFRDRKAECGKFLSRWRQLTNLDHTMLNAAMSVRRQFFLKTKPCTEQKVIRVREYLMGKHSDTTSYTIDIKDGANKMQEAMNIPLYPSRYCHRNSYQKAEIDIHSCYWKYSRETRCFFESEPFLRSCEDITMLFPEAFPRMKPEHRKNAIGHSSDEFWWVMEHEGQLKTELSDGRIVYTDIQSTFTLNYNTFAMARRGKFPNDGEWSFRILSQNNGKDPDFLEEVVHHAHQIYNGMINIFGTMDYPCYDDFIHDDGFWGYYDVDDQIYDEMIRDYELDIQLYEERAIRRRNKQNNNNENEINY
eukprot:TRINITY_DN6289_c0_g2_i1.p1 TRINITY_DN6289_c0_g2~~TRINITY_DN6289_c0_g2_i1.p1  ORF type:complete len:377 (-),score=94.85 TRINITY_DN6289_c0_g2_i1:47-1177(-)